MFFSVFSGFSTILCGFGCSSVCSTRCLVKKAYIKTRKCIVERFFQIISPELIKSDILKNEPIRENVSHYSFTGIHSCYMLKIDARRLRNLQRFPSHLTVYTKQLICPTLPWKPISVPIDSAWMKNKRWKQ